MDKNCFIGFRQYSDDEYPMRKANTLVRKSGLTYQQIGDRMGYPKKSARQSVNQLLGSTNPTIATLRRLAKALGVDVRKLL